MKPLHIVFLSVCAFTFSNCREPLEPVADMGWVERLDATITSNQKSQIHQWVFNDGFNSGTMERAFALYKPHSDLYTAFSTAKSVYHQMVLVNDQVETIPGISKGAFTANGLTRADLLPTPVDSALMLPASEAPNFTEAKDTLLPAGAKIYRVIGGAGSFPTGGYWTETKPANYAEIIGGTAVAPEWNGFNNIVTFTVPAGGVKVWRGRAAKQPIAGNTNKFATSYLSQYHLAGGGMQLYMPFVYRNFRDTAVINRFNRQITMDTITWKKR